MSQTALLPRQVSLSSESSTHKSMSINFMYRQGTEEEELVYEFQGSCHHICSGEDWETAKQAQHPLFLRALWQTDKPLSYDDVSFDPTTRCFLVRQNDIPESSLGKNHVSPSDHHIGNVSSQSSSDQEDCIVATPETQISQYSTLCTLGIESSCPTCAQNSWLWSGGQGRIEEGRRVYSCPACSRLLEYIAN